MRDCDVRNALYVRLEDSHAAEASDTLFVDELGLCGQVRIDVAVVNGALTGYELKSERDTLRRLPTQVDVYSQVLDFATLVVATSHLEKAVELLPLWWGVIEARGQRASPSVVLHEVRAGSLNPKINSTSLTQLLWRSEALEELELRGLDRGVRSRPRTEIWARLAEALPVDELRGVVRQRLKDRREWRPAQ